MWTLDNDGAEALLTVVLAPAAQLVVRPAPSVVQEERPF